MVRVQGKTEASHDGSSHVPRLDWTGLQLSINHAVVVFATWVCFGVRLDLQHQLEVPNCRYALSPVVWMTWSDEDFIGRISRMTIDVMQGPRQSDQSIGPWVITEGNSERTSAHHIRQEGEPGDERLEVNLSTSINDALNERPGSPVAFQACLDVKSSKYLGEVVEVGAWRGFRGLKTLTFFFHPLAFWGFVVVFGQTLAFHFV